MDEGSVVIRDVEQSDAGEYTCEAWNLAGSKTTPPIHLNVHSKSTSMLYYDCKCTLNYPNIWNQIPLILLSIKVISLLDIIQTSETKIISAMYKLSVLTNCLLCIYIKTVNKS